MGVCVALDLGGTRARLAAIGDDYAVLDRAVVPSRGRTGYAVANDIVEGLNALKARHGAVALGMASVGLVGQGRERDVSRNLPEWRAEHVGHIARAVGLPWKLINDVKAAGLAELRLGSLRGADPGLYVNLGTGVAVAISIGGRVVEGFHGASGEIGNWVPIKGERGFKALPSLESQVGGWGVEERARAIGLKGGAREVADCQEEPAQLLWRDVLEQAATAIANCAIAVDPAVVSLGGGMSLRQDTLDAVRLAVEDFCLFAPPVVVSELGDDAGLVGAAIYAREGLA